MTTAPRHRAILAPSRIQEIMKAGGVARSVKLNITDATIAELAGLAGYDAVWLCQEHCPNSLMEIQHCIRSAAAVGIDTIVRVAKGSYSDLVKPLEIGAAAIMVPHVMTAKEAKELAYQTKFHPIGRRALDSGNADGAYCMAPLTEYMEHANTHRLVMAQIEDPEAIEELDGIAAVPGIDVLFFGPGDFAQGLGCPGKFDHPKIIEARKAVVAAARKHGKWAATVGGVANYRELVALGYNYINLGADVIGLQQYFANVISQTNPTAEEAKKIESLYK